MSCYDPALVIEIAERERDEWVEWQTREDENNSFCQGSLLSQLFSSNSSWIPCFLPVTLSLSSSRHNGRAAKQQQQLSPLSFPCSSQESLVIPAVVLFLIPSSLPVTPSLSSKCNEREKEKTLRTRSLFSSAREDDSFVAPLSPLFPRQGEEGNEEMDR